MCTFNFTSAIWSPCQSTSTTKWLHYLGTVAQLSAMYLYWCYYKQYC